MIYCGDNMKILESLDSHSIDSVCTDPPYALNFMGKKWDADVPSVELWAEVLRVLKPGGHVLSFGGTRTYHRMVVNIEDAGFEIRDQLQWIYGSGFPKSHNISKAIDKKYGAKREVVGTQHIPGRSTAYSKGYVSTENDCGGKTRGHFKSDDPDTIAITKPSTDQAKQWDGFGTALKPSNEPIVLARKPLSEKTIVDNVLKHGVGALNIDGCRIGPPQNKMVKGMSKAGNTYSTAEWDGSYHLETQGRWPANTLFDWEAAQRLDEQSGVLKSGARTGPNKTHSLNGKGAAKYGKYDHTGGECNASEGGASRFFYCAKASKSERNAGLEGMDKKLRSNANKMMGDSGPMKTGSGNDRTTHFLNHHPTVKPLKLMQYLVRLITPPNGVCLDPFMGSGTTGLACKNEGFKFIGIEINEEYYEIASRRLGA